MWFDTLLIVGLKSFFFFQKDFVFYLIVCNNYSEISSAYSSAKEHIGKKFKHKLKHEHIFQVEKNEIQTKDYSNN